MATELGQTTNPKDLVPGDSRQIRDTIRALTAYGHALEDVGHGLRTIDEGGWKGPAADAFRARFDQQPKRWLEAGDAFLDASQALNSYAYALESAQTRAGDAIARWEQAKPLTEAAAIQHFMTPRLTFNDPGDPIREEAREILNRARQQLTDAGNDAAKLIGAARDLAPPHPTFLQNIGAFFTGIGEELKNTAWLLNPFNWDDATTAAAQLAQLAKENPEAAAKIIADYETLQDDPAKWLGSFLAGTIASKGAGRLLNPRLGRHLDQHVFRGHQRPHWISGYHHRPGGEDPGDFKVVEITKQPDINGVYEGKIEGKDAGGQIRHKNSTFFPNDWTKGQIEDAIIEAFDNRTPAKDSSGQEIPGKWTGEYNGIRIEGFIDPQLVRAGIDVRTAKLFDIATAYPKHQP